MGSSSQWAARLEELQYTVGEGPSVQAFGSGGPVLVSDVAREDGRWPGFTASASEAGLGAMFAFPVQAGSVRLGTLDLYRRRPGGLATGALADAAVLAELATVAVLDDSARDEQAGRLDLTVRNVGRRQVSGRGGMGHYDEVNLATGILAAQLRLSVTDASARLRAHAFSQRQSLDQVASEIIAQRLRLDEPHE
jgi:hypothetical protein